MPLLTPQMWSEWQRRQAQAYGTSRPPPGMLGEVLGQPYDPGAPGEVPVGLGGTAPDVGIREPTGPGNPAPLPGWDPSQGMPPKEVYAPEDRWRYGGGIVPPREVGPPPGMSQEAWQQGEDYLNRINPGRMGQAPLPTMGAGAMSLGDLMRGGLGQQPWFSMLQRGGGLMAPYLLQQRQQQAGLSPLGQFAQQSMYRR